MENSLMLKRSESNAATRKQARHRTTVTCEGVCWIHSRPAGNSYATLSHHPICVPAVGEAGVRTHQYSSRIRSSVMGHGRSVKSDLDMQPLPCGSCANSRTAICAPNDTSSSVSAMKTGGANTATFSRIGEVRLAPAGAPLVLLLAPEK